jgi:hypothetical protein
MNLTVNDIKEEVLSYKKDLENFEEGIKKTIFEEYDKVDEIKKVLNDLDNSIGGLYEFDEMNDLVYGIKIPDNIIDLPFINDYLTQDYAFIHKFSGNNKEICLAQNCGEVISVNYSHDSKGYFVFARDEREVVIDKKFEWMDSKYISAKIEDHQTGKGVFGDVVVIDNYYGSYCKHFERDREVNENNYKEIIQQYEDKFLTNKEEE